MKISKYGFADRHRKHLSPQLKEKDKKLRKEQQSAVFSSGAHRLFDGTTAEARAASCAEALGGANVVKTGTR